MGDEDCRRPATLTQLLRSLIEGSGNHLANDILKGDANLIRVQQIPQEI